MRFWLKVLREKAKMTQGQVALSSNISRSYYTNIENGTKTPSVEVAKLIGSTLNFPWENFFDNKSSLKERKII